MHRANVHVYRSSSNVLLIAKPVPAEFIKWVQFLPLGLTIYKKVPEARLAQTDAIDIQCVCCQSKWRLGQWLCLNCWEPALTRAVKDMRPRCKKDDVPGEIWGAFWTHHG